MILDVVRVIYVWARLKFYVFLTSRDGCLLNLRWVVVEEGVLPIQYDRRRKNQELYR
jgi:hypothetical protein